MRSDVSFTLTVRICKTLRLPEEDHYQCSPNIAPGININDFLGYNMVLKLNFVLEDLIRPNG